MAEPQETIDLIEHMKASYAASSFGVALMTNELGLPFLNNLVKINELTPPLSVVLPKKMETRQAVSNTIKGESYKLDIEQSIKYISSNPQARIDFLRNLTAAIIISVGDAIARNQYFDRDPAIEFLRHLRNGIAHGNRFNFKHGEPKRLAFFKNFKITEDLEGSVVLIEDRESFIDIGDIFELFDFIALHLKSTINL